MRYCPVNGDLISECIHCITAKIENGLKEHPISCFYDDEDIFLLVARTRESNRKDRIKLESKINGIA